MALVHSPRIACDAGGFGRGGRRASARSRPLTAEDGLPQATVMTTLQDSQGFVWLGTEDGLVRFDGRELYRYAARARSRARCPATTFGKSSRTREANLWVAINDAGVAKWDRRTDTFTSYRHDPNDPTSLASDRIRTVLVDARGFVWIGTFDAGVDVLDPVSGQRRAPASRPGRCRLARERPRLHADARPCRRRLDRHGPRAESLARETRTMTRVGPPPGDARSLHEKRISRVLEDQSGTLWIGTFDAGLVRMDRDGRVLETFRHDAGNAASLGSDDVRALLEDQSGRFWVGTAEGLALLDRVHGRVQPLSTRRERQRVAARFVRHVAVSGSRRARLGRHAHGRRQPLEPAQLGARRPSAGVARESARHRLRGCAGQPRVDRVARGGLVRFDAATGPRRRSTRSPGGRTR